MAWRVFTALCVVATAVVAAEIFRSLWTVFMAGGFADDHVNYTNMIWNSGHGAPFRMFVSGNYLQNHLSFSLIPIGFLYHLWDHPFLLPAFQWLLMCAGLFTLLAAARRLRLPTPTLAALGLFFIGCVLAQRPLVNSFHGTTTYFLLVPWLYYTLRFCKGWAILPLALLLGIREDAFLCVLPMLAHAAWRDRSISATALLGLAISYGLFALLWLFPHINGIDIFARRSEIARPDRLFATWHGTGLKLRWQAALLWAPPILLFIRRRGTAAWLYPSIAILTALFSNFARQYALQIHYPAPVLTTLAIGLVESSAGARAALKPGSRDTTNLRAVALVCIMVVAHVYWGYIRTGGHNGSQYRFLDPEGPVRLHAGRSVPKDGILVTGRKLASYTANRRDLILWQTFDPDKTQPDIFFERIRRFKYLLDGDVLQRVRNGSFGIVYYDSAYAVAQRGAATDKNDEFLALCDNMDNTLFIANSRSESCENRHDPGVGIVRFWEGDGSRAPISVSHGSSMVLSPGRYRVHIRYRAETPRRTVRKSWGQFGVFPSGRDDPFALVPIDEISEPGGRYREQIVAFTNPKEGPVEFRVIGADAPLWVLSARFEAEQEQPDT